MKTGLKILSVLMLVSSLALAQDYNKRLKKELEVEDLYPSKKAAATQVVEVTEVKTQEVQGAPAPTVVYGPQLQQQQQVVAPQPQAQVQVVAPAPVQQAVQQQPQPIFILQQPTTNIEATPVKESRTEQLRKQREEVERQNEMKLMERLEDERLNAEKERSEKILTNQSAAPVATPSPAPQVQVTPAPVVIVPVQTEVVPAGAQPKVQEAAPQADSILAKAIVAEKIEDIIEKNKMIIGISGGAAEYPSAGNVSGAFALGGSFEIRFPSRIGIEGAVNYSSFDITNVNTCYNCYGATLVTTMNQWDVSGGFKYNLFKATISPIVGAVFDYTRRNYAARVTYGYNNPSFTGSNAFSGGAMAGFEVKASDNIIIGGSLTYMMNISYRTDDPLTYGYGGFVYNVGTPIESLNYFFATLNTKLIF